MFTVELQNPTSFHSRLKRGDDPDVFTETSKAHSTMQLAAAICYNASMEKAKAVAHTIPVGKVWKSAHHTTAEHGDHYASFILENIPVSLATFGLHLQNSFYNSSQRSGRFCHEMFKTNYVSYCEDFLTKFTPIPRGTNAFAEIVQWVVDGVQYFNRNLGDITERARDAILDERPHYAGNIDTQSKRIAQEQLRCFISTIFPTGMMYTIDLPTLVAFFECAWNKPLYHLFGRMCGTVFTTDKLRDMVKNAMSFENEVISQHVDIDGESAQRIMVDKIATRVEDVSIPYVPSFLFRDTEIIYSPKSECLSGEIQTMFEKFNKIQRHKSIDLTQFSPHANPIDINNFKSDSGHEIDNADIVTAVEVSVATFGQDQRHRTIRRGLPTVTGNVYCPPLLRDHSDDLRKHMERYMDMARRFGPENMIHFIPYGATVSYVKKADPRAFYHEVRKRRCLNAQEEIYNLADMVVGNIFDPNDVHRPGPPCMTGKCSEGDRYCGRDTNFPVKRILI